MKGGQVGARIGLMVVAILLTILLAEGCSSLLLGRSLRPRSPFVELAEVMSAGGGLDTAAGSHGQFRVHPDPRVGVALRTGTGFKILDSTYSVDSLGVRRRPGGDPPNDALRVAIVGDSVAFGAGVNDDQTLAAQLEVLLNDVRPPDARPVACYTVAVSGWNHRNATHFLLDHFEEYRPEIVIYIPVDNDLTDTYGIFEQGNRRIGFDAMSPQLLLPINDEPRYLFQYHLGQRVRAGETSSVGVSQIGVPALTADLSPESRSRYDANAESILHFSSSLAALGTKLALMFYTEHGTSAGYTWIVRERLLNRGAQVPEIPGLTKLATTGTLPNDAHPDAAGHRTLAIWIAEWLGQQGWIDLPSGVSLPAPLAEMDAMRSAPRSELDIRTNADALRDRMMGRAQSVIDLDHGRGVQQILGGVNPNGTIGPRFLGMLKRGGEHVRVVVAGLEPAPAVAIALEVAVDGVIVGTLAVSRGEVSKSFQMPPSDDPSGCVEVSLGATDWVVRPDVGRLATASCRLVSVSIE